MSTQMTQCIESCQQCHQVCLKTIQHCLSMGGKHAEASHIHDLTDCAQLCVVAADFMIRQSPLHEKTWGVCADACVRCAESCERLNDSQEMQTCVDACRKCETDCRSMAAEAAG